MTDRPAEQEVTRVLADLDERLLRRDGVGATGQQQDAVDVAGQLRHRGRPVGLRQRHPAARGDLAAERGELADEAGGLGVREGVVLAQDGDLAPALLVVGVAAQARQPLRAVPAEAEEVRAPSPDSVVDCAPEVPLTNVTSGWLLAYSATATPSSPDSGPSRILTPDLLDQAARLGHGLVRRGVGAAVADRERRVPDLRAGHLVLGVGAVGLAAGLLDQRVLGPRERLGLEGGERTTAGGQHADLDRPLGSVRRRGRRSPTTRTTNRRPPPQAASTSIAALTTATTAPRPFSRLLEFLIDSPAPWLRSGVRRSRPTPTDNRLTINADDRDHIFEPSRARVRRVPGSCPTLPVGAERASGTPTAGGGPNRPTACPTSRGYRAVGMSKEASRSSSGQRWVTTFARV